MIKYALSLCISLFLAVGPVAAQIQEAAVGGRGAPQGVGATGAVRGETNSTVPGLPSATPGLVGTLNGRTSSVIIQPDRPQTLNAISPVPAAADVHSLITPSFIANPETAVKNPSLTPDAQSNASRYLDVVAAQFAGLGNRKPEALAVTVSAPKRPWYAFNRLKLKVISATLTAAMVAMVTVTPVVHSYNARVLPIFNPVVAAAKFDSNETQDALVHATDINDAIAKWTPDTHLIMIGNPLDTGSQKALASWLAKTHWTVVLMQANGNSSYKDNEGRTHYGEEALKFAIGQGIPHKSGFSSFIHEASGLPDGSVLLLSINQHFMALHNSAAQKAHGLDGETEFISRNPDRPTKTDRWIIEHMRRNGNIMGAVKDTVTNIDALLDRAVAAAAQNAESSIASAKASVEAYAQARSAFVSAHPSAAATIGAADLAGLRAQLASAQKALAAKNTVEAALIAGKASATALKATSAMRSYEDAFTAGQDALASARKEVTTLEEASASFLREHPKATGDLAHPDTRAMRDQLASAESTLSADPSGAKSSANSIASKVRSALNALHEYASGADKIAASEAVLKQLLSSKHARAASSALTTARQSLREAREAHDLGASMWSSHLQSAKSALAKAERSISDAAAAASRNAAIFLALMGLMTLLTGGLAFFLNRRARIKAAEAQTLYDAWDTGLHLKSNSNIDKLIEKVRLYAAVSGATKRDYTGESADLARQVRGDSGQATLLLAKARQIHALANDRLHPAIGTPGWLINLFWPSRFAEAIRLLKDEPVTFKPEEGASLFGAEKTWRDDLFGEISSYQPFRKSFNEVIAEFNKMAAAALSSVERLEYAVTQNETIITAVVAELKSSAARKTSPAFKTGALFAVPSLFSAAIPAGEALAAAARATVKTDPISAIYGAAEQAKRISADVKSLLGLLEGARVNSLASSTAA